MKKLNVLKAQKTKLIKKQCKTIEEFVEIQDKLNKIEFEIKLLERG